VHHQIELVVPCTTTKI